jgi:hypothetical protein
VKGWNVGLNILTLTFGINRTTELSDLRTGSTLKFLGTHLRVEPRDSACGEKDLSQMKILRDPPGIKSGTSRASSNCPHRNTVLSTLFVTMTSSKRMTLIFRRVRKIAKSDY